MTHSADNLSGEDLLDAVAEAEGVPREALEPWGVFSREVWTLERRDGAFVAHIKLPASFVFPPGWYAGRGPDPLTATLRAFLKVNEVRKSRGTL